MGYLTNHHDDRRRTMSVRDDIRRTTEAFNRHDVTAAAERF
jgi:hypothetical protein